MTKGNGRYTIDSMRKKLRVALVGPYCDTQTTREAMPMQSYTANLAAALVSNGCALDILTEQAAGSRKNPSERSVGFMHVKRCFRVSQRPFLHLFREIRKSEYDIVHVQHETFLYGGPQSLVAFLLFLAALKGRAKTIVTLHHVIHRESINADMAKMYYSGVPALAIRLFFSFFYYAIGKVADGLIVHQEYARNVLIHDYRVSGSKIRFIPHGTRRVAIRHRNALARRRYGLSSSDVVFGFFGFLEESKGIDIILREFAEYAKNHPNAALAIAGDEHPRLRGFAPYKEFIRTLKKNAEAQGAKVRWIGKIAERDIPFFLSAVDCLILPYRFRKGGSSVLSWALATRTFVFVSHVFRSAVHDNEMVFSLEDGSLRKKMVSFTKWSVQKRTRIRETIGEIQKKSSWPNVGHATVDFYQRVIVR